MEEFKPFSYILSLPLFQGLSRNDLEEVVAHTKFAFSKVHPNRYIVKEGDSCEHLVFILNGTVECEAEADDHSYSITETMHAPEVIQPEHIFGLRQRYSRSFKAMTNCSIMSIDKSEIMKLSDKFNIFRINLLNIISTKVQKAAHEVWRTPPTCLEQRITRFIENHCIYPAGEKTIHIKMVRLAEEVNDSRIDVSKALNHMQEEGLLTLFRGRIEIPALEKLITNN